jgi:quinol monooxygenase YgiN
MSGHFLAAVAGALLAAVGSGVLAMRCARAPNAAVAAWTVATFGLFVALVAQALGYHTRFGAITFRAMELGAQVVAPLALGLGLAEVAAKSLAARFAARLLLSAIAFVAIVVLATDPLSSAIFTKAWPSAGVYYQPIPNALLKDLLAPVTVLVALIGAATAASRQGRDPTWRPAFAPAALSSLAMLVLAVPGIAALLRVSVPLASAFVLLCILAAGLTWLAGVQASRLQLGVMRGDRDADGSGPDAAGDFGPAHDDDDEFGIYRRNGTRRGSDLDYRGAAGDQAGYPEEAGYRGAGYPDQPADHGYGSQAGYGDETGYQDAGYQDGSGYPDREGYGDQAGYPERQAGYPEDGAYAEHGQYPGGDGYDDGRYPEQAGYPDQARYPEPGYPDETGYADEAGYRDPAAAGAGQQMFGQIAIHTLVEDRVDDFDRLTTSVVRQVRSHEPGTLVYIVHAVPSAPLQRILYEVYRDRAAYEEHRRQPYVVSFEADRRPYVLATNVIELGLQQAKVSPMPSVTDLLSDTGFDLLNDTGFGHPGYGPRRAPRHGMPEGGSGSRQLG